MACIVPLKGENYPTWKVQCKMSLMKDGLWGIVSGTEVEPEEGTQAHAKFLTRRDHALAIIVLSLDPSLLYLIGDPTDPAAVWTKLSTQFQRKTWANKLALRRRLHSLRLRDGQKVQDHMKSITEIFDGLAVLGDDISNEDRVVYLLASLPESYDMLVTALEANATVPEMESVIERLLHEERKMNEKSHAVTDEGAMIMDYHKRKGPRCHYCNKFGHIQRNCHEREKNQKSEPPTSNKPKHKVNSVKTRDSDSEEVGLVAQHTFSAHGTRIMSSTKWIIDSGATSHFLQQSWTVR